MKKSALLWLSLPILLLTGCTRNGVSADPVQGIAASIMAGNAFDHAQIALTRNDSAGLQLAGTEMRRAADAGSNQMLTNVFTEAIAAQASQLSALASLSRGQDRTSFLTQSDQMYRAALGFAPTVSPEKALDPITLNSIGYFLADRGESKADFEKGALYTKAAYDKWPILTGLGANQSLSGRATAAQDSYAWSLFKLGQFGEASVQEEAALKTARELAPNSINAEIPFHMAEIYRVLGEKDKAKAEYDTALQLNPTDDLISKVKSGVQSLDYKQL